MSSILPSPKPVSLSGPFDSFRDYISAVDARGELLRIATMDQDKFEATGFAYRMVEEFGFDQAPPFMIERIKINGVWMDSPVLGNVFGGWTNEALAWGVPNITDDHRAMYRATFDHLVKIHEAHGGWPKIAPVTVAAGDAPCKEVIVQEADVDILKFPWIQTNPGDAGAYITAGTVFIEDPELGRNVATYRCQVKGKNRIGINTEVGQNAWSFLMRFKQRGRKTVPAAVVIGVDPITFAVGTSKLTGLGEDELHVAGGLRGSPVELVKCETSAVHVPAGAEIVIEGEISVTEMEEEGPYGEVYGYMGLKKPSNFFMTVKTVTHRRNPWVINAFAGITKLTMSTPQIVANNLAYRKVIPNLVEFYRPIETIGVAVVSIDKRFPGDGMVAGQHIAASDMFAKAIIVVDKDIDVHDKTQIFQAIGTRWQPHPASVVIPQTRGFPLDPSQPRRWLTSKIIIDATKQLPSEGGPEKWPAVSREIIEKQSPETFEIVASRWAEYWKDWRR